MQYNEKDLLVLAKRYNNSKRQYLLVNPLQGKHLAVSPRKSLEMMDSLGKIVNEHCKGFKLVIGFAETATAIGARVAMCLGNDCLYVQTTRENQLLTRDHIFFSEDHSHAVLQGLCVEQFQDVISNSNGVILVDDEFSTGNTLIHIVDNLKKRFPQIKEKSFVACSIINRISEENENLLKENGIQTLCLLHLDNRDYEKEIADINVEGAVVPEYIKNEEYTVFREHYGFSDPRVIISAKEYKKNIARLYILIKEHISNESDKYILIMGTEECMLPALIIGENIERENAGKVVRTHSTTRSPIGILKDADYPVNEGYKIRSFYDKARETYIYNPYSYDLVILITDSTHEQEIKNGLEDIEFIFGKHGCKRFLIVDGNLSATSEVV